VDKNTRIISTFENNSLDDHTCEHCIHYAEHGEQCPPEVCCCAKEKTEALTREIAAENTLAAASVRRGET